MNSEVRGTEHSRSSRQNPAGELYRMTHPGGPGIRQVDFRDRRDFSRSLEDLPLEQDEFEGLFAERHGACGRQTRPIEIRALLEDEGFEVKRLRADGIAQDHYLENLLPRLCASRSVHRDAPESDLRNIGGRFCLHKPVIQ